MVSLLSLSPDGTKALFRTAAAFEPLDTGPYEDCYVRHLQSGTTELASFRNDGSGSGNTSRRLAPSRATRLCIFSAPRTIS